MVSQLELDFVVLLMLLPVGLVFEVCFLGYVEINPHDAVIGQGREHVPLLDQAALKDVQAVDDAVETCCDLGKVEFGLRLIRLGLGLCQFGLVQFHLFLRDAFFVGQRLGVIQLQLREVFLGHLGVPLGLVKNWQISNNTSPSFTAWPSLIVIGLEIAVLQCADIDMSPRVDLADILLGDDDVLCHRAGDRDLMFLLVGLLASCL